MKTSRNHLLFFVISGSLLAIPAWLAALYGYFLVVPPILAIIGTWLLIRSYKSHKNASVSELAGYRRFTLLAHVIYNGLCAIGLIIFIGNAFGPNLRGTYFFYYVLVAYLFICGVIAYLGRQVEKATLKSTATPPAPIPPQSATRTNVAKSV